MGLYIPNVKLPKDGNRHRITIYDDGNSYITTANRFYETEWKDIEVFEIPDSVIEIGAKFILLGDKVNRIIEEER